MTTPTTPLGFGTPDLTQYQGAIVVSAARWGISPALLVTEIRSLVSVGTTPNLDSHTIDTIARNLGTLPPVEEATPFSDDQIPVSDTGDVPNVWADPPPQNDGRKRLALILVAMLVVAVGIWFVVPPHR